MGAFGSTCRAGPPHATSMSRVEIAGVTFTVNPPAVHPEEQIHIWCGLTPRISIARPSGRIKDMSNLHFTKARVLHSSLRVNCKSTLCVTSLDRRHEESEG